MPRDYTARLQNLRARRLGLRAPSERFAETLLERIQKSERYEKRDNRGAVRYALGAMQEVDQQYTQVGLDEANRVGRALTSALAANGIMINCDLQGSVPLNVHTRGASDVDILALHAAFLTVDSSGHKSTGGWYFDHPRSVASYMQELRTKSETALKAHFYAAEVDTSGAKSISIEGGSLKRKVDVVPSHWHDTAAYQLSNAKHDRGVNVWNNDTKTTAMNKPFLHIKGISDKCALTRGGLRKTIRLAKNVRNDAIEEGKVVDVSSYEIAAAMWHCDPSLLMVQPVADMALLYAAQAHLESLANNPTTAGQLRTPDGTRRIFDTTAKLTALGKLASEVTQLAEDVAREFTTAVNANSPLDRQVLRKALQEAYIAAA